MKRRTYLVIWVWVLAFSVMLTALSIDYSKGFDLQAAMLGFNFSNLAWIACMLVKEHNEKREG